MKDDPSYEQYNKIYTETYNTRNYGKSLAGVCMQRAHVVLEKLLPQKNYGEVLEVGGGPQGHLHYVKHTYDRYYYTDRHQPSLNTSREELSAALQDKVTFQIEDALHLSFEDNRFDRVIACNILEHVPDPYKALREWNRVLKPGGTLSIILPCDPGMLYRLGRHFGPRKEAEKVGIAYDYWMAREHINPFNNLYVFIHYYFNDIQDCFWPMRVRSMDMNLLYACNINKHG